MGEFIISIIKLVLALLSLPIVVAACNALFEHVHVYPYGFGSLFFNGGITFLFVFIFLHQFEGVYLFGKKMVEGMFSLLAPLNTALAQVLSLYLVVLLPAFFVSHSILKMNNFDAFFMFAIGFCFAMQIVLSAQDLQSAETAIIKPEYMFMINIVILVNVVLLVLFAEFIIGNGKFMPFINIVWHDAIRIYRMCFGKALL